MSTNLSNEILEKFLELMEKDQHIGKNLAKKIYNSISTSNITKDDILTILKTETNNNENSEDRN